MIVALWLVYTFATSLLIMTICSAILATAGVIGTAVFVRDVIKKRRRLAREEIGFVLLIAVVIVLAVVSSLSVPFVAQGDAYAYYVPIGRYLNQYPGQFINSAYRFSLSRNFAYYALYAHADLVGGFADSYRYLPIPFLLGTILGIVSVSQRITTQKVVPPFAATCYVFSVYFGLILRFNMFSLGNLLMSTIALFYCFALLGGLERSLEKLSIPVSSFAMLLLYDYTILLLLPLALTYLASRRPRAVFFAATCVAMPFVLLISLESLSLEFVQFPKFDLQNSVAFFGLIVVILAGLKGRQGAVSSYVPSFLSIILAYAGAIGSLSLQEILNLFNFGFATVANYPLSAPVLAYAQTTGWFYQTPPDVVGTTVSILFSDAFFGWGLFFTLYGIVHHRGSTTATFFLTLIPLAILIETVNNNYLRFATFLVPLIVVFLSLGLVSLIRKNAFQIGVALTLSALLLKAVTTFPTLDYEHRAIPNPIYVGVFAILVLIATSYFGLTRSLRDRERARFIRNLEGVLRTNLRQVLDKFRYLSSMRWRWVLSIVMIALSVSLLSYNVLTDKYPSETYPADAKFVDQHVLPLILDKSTVVTVELVHADFNFYKNLIIIPMSQPWVLESFLRLQISNTTQLVTWLNSSRVNYVFLDLGLVSSNPAVFGVFNQLSTSCQTLPHCGIAYDDGRFVLIRLG